MPGNWKKLMTLNLRKQRNKKEKESNVLWTRKVPGNRLPRKQQETVPREEHHGKTLGHCRLESLIILVTESRGHFLLSRRSRDSQ